MYKVVLLRHGESEWNKANLFTGWTDVDLSEKGRQEAKQAAELLKQEGYTFDIAYTSVLKRAIRTLWIVLDGMDLMWIPVIRSWRLNERMYGALQGLNKAQTAEKYGEDRFISGAADMIFSRRRWIRTMNATRARTGAMRICGKGCSPPPSAESYRERFFLPYGRHHSPHDQYRKAGHHCRTRQQLRAWSNISIIFR